MSPQLLRRMLALRQIRLLAGAELNELAMLAENVADATFVRGAVVARAGLPLRAIHVVLEGTIASPERGLAWGAHQVFGALEVLSGRPLASAAVATTSTRTLQLFADDVSDLLDDNFGLLRATLRELATAALAVPPHHAALAIPDVDPLGFVDRLLVLRQLAPLSGARLDGVAMLAQGATEVVVPPGVELVRAGEPAPIGHVIVEGALAARRATGETRAVHPGDAIGLLELLAGADHGWTVETATRVRALECSATAMFDVIEDRTELGIAMIASLAAMLLDIASDSTNGHDRRRTSSTTGGSPPGPSRSW
ncbi:MAG TPA: cyclic nucleotide-binding domain-containing protein [Kofleriaceae bacterium]|nr:cyclic nucleotide-binding domain-containing protein [Kofleriaceae bacterium]